MKIYHLLPWLCVLVLAIGCQNTESPDSTSSADSATPADFGCFEGGVVASWDDDGRNMTLREDFVYVDPKSRRWVAPSGSVVNGASIPSAFWTLIGGPFEGKYRNASVVHDVGCDDMTASWEDVHRMFYEACRCGGVDEAKAKMLYYAVYHFGPRWEPVTETHIEKRQNEAGEMVEHEVTRRRMVRVHREPPTDEEVEKVRAFVKDENPKLSVLKKTDRDVLRRRPHPHPDRFRNERQPGDVKRPEGGPEHPSIGKPEDVAKDRKRPASPSEHFSHDRTHENPAMGQTVQPPSREPAGGPTSESRDRGQPGMAGLGRPSR